MLYDAANPIATIFDSADARERRREMDSHRPWEQNALWWVPENASTGTQGLSARDSLLLLAVLGLSELTFAFNRTAYIDKFLQLNSGRNWQWPKNPATNDYVHF